MSAANQFLYELIRAANGRAKIDDGERQRLLNRSVVMIRDMREEAGISQSKVMKRVVADLQGLIVAVHCGHAADAQTQAGLLKAASVIRDLHIVLDAKTANQCVA